MGNKTFTKQQLVAYILLYIANIDLKESNSERNYIMSRVDRNVFDDIYKEFNNDNDYQSITKIVDGVNSEDSYKNNPDELFADIKLMAFADGKMDQMEHAIYNSLKKILS